jgi:hypothetical protein
MGISLWPYARRGKTNRHGRIGKGAPTLRLLAEGSISPPETRPGWAGPFDHLIVKFVHSDLVRFFFFENI